MTKIKCPDCLGEMVFHGVNNYHDGTIVYVFSCVKCGADITLEAKRLR